MLSELMLLLLESEEGGIDDKRLPEEEKTAVLEWCGTEDLSKALRIFEWCARSGEGAFCILDEEMRDFEFQCASDKLGIGKDELKRLTETFSSLCYTECSSQPTPIEGRGRLIVLEGLDGAGKTTHIGLLKEKLIKDGRRVFSTAEPTGYATGGLIRDALGGLHKRDASELAALFLADRVAHNTNKKDGIIGFLESGVDVICDRYYYSSLAYQGIDSDIAWVADMNVNCPMITKPDICIFLDLSPEAAVKRIEEGRLTSEIYETYEIIRRVKRRFADAFRMLNGRDNIRIVNSDRPKEKVAEEIYSAVSAL